MENEHKHTHTKITRRNTERTENNDFFSSKNILLKHFSHKSINTLQNVVLMKQQI